MRDEHLKYTSIDMINISSMEESCVKIFRTYAENLPDGAQHITRGLPTNIINHHLHLNISDVTPGPTPDTVIYCQLYSERRDTWVSERWCNARSQLSGSQQTIFPDIGGLEFSSDLHVVISVFRLGRIVNNQQVFTSNLLNPRPQ